MEKMVQKIAIASNPGETYFLQIDWEEDLDKGFTVILCDGQTAWTGEVSAEDVCREAADMEMERAKYVDELKKALITATTSKYRFDLVKDGKDNDTYCFTYEKKLKEVSFKLGSLQLKNVKKPAKIIKDLINYCLTTTAELHSRNEYLQKENERLHCDWVDMQEQLEKFVKSKEELEQDLYTRFTCVLNEKKAKIRSLNEKLSQAQKKVPERSNSSIPFDTVPVSDIKNEYYDASTDEESSPEDTIKPSAPLAIAKRRSLVHSPDDSPDIAPSRKRRQRGQKSIISEVKEKVNPQQDQRCEAAPSKTTGKNPSSENLSLPTSKNTPDPDDLFSDI